MKPEFEFYYKTKYEDTILEKAAQEENNDAEKFAANLKDMAVVFAKKNPKAAEGAITGGILGAGSELFMPSRTDITGQPATNMGEIAKRGLLGATLGGVGGALKANVSKRISDIPMPKMAEENFDKIALEVRQLKNFANRMLANHPDKILPMAGGLGLGTLGAGIGYGNYKMNEPFMLEEHKDPSKKALMAIGAGLSGGVGVGAGMDVANQLKDYKGRYDDVEPLYQKAKGFQDVVSKAKDVKNRLLTKTLPAHIPSPNPGTGYKTIKKLKKGVEVLSKIAENKEAGLLDLAAKIPTLQKSQLAGKAIQGISNVTGNIGTNGIMNTAGKYMVKNPRIGGAVLGAGAGLVGNTLSGSDHALGSTLAGAGLGALGGRSLLAGSLKKSPLLGKNFAAGAKSELSAMRAAKAPSPVNASSLQNAPPLSDLVAQSGVKVPQQTIPKITPGLSTPQKPQEMNFNS